MYVLIHLCSSRSQFHINTLFGYVSYLRIGRTIHETFSCRLHNWNNLEVLLTNRIVDKLHFAILQPYHSVESPRSVHAPSAFQSSPFPSLNPNFSRTENADSLHHPAGTHPSSSFVSGVSHHNLSVTTIKKHTFADLTPHVSDIFKV